MHTETTSNKLNSKWDGYGICTRVFFCKFNACLLIWKKSWLKLMSCAYDNIASTHVHTHTHNHSLTHTNTYNSQKKSIIYRSVLGKCPWALNHKPSFFTILGACPMYWALTVCNNWKNRSRLLWAWRWLGTRTCVYACSIIEHVCMIFRPSTRATRKE